MTRLTAKKIGNYRILKGLSVAALAKKAGVSRETIYSYENGKYFPKPTIIAKIAKILDCEIKDLID